MLELGPGVYTSPRLNPAVRDRIWCVLEEWFVREQDASIVMVFEDPSQPGGQSIRVLGLPPIELVSVDGLVLSRRT